MRALPYESTVSDIVRQIDEFERGDGFEVEPTIFAVEPWTPESAAVVLALDVVDGVAPSRPQYVYLLEIDIAVEVLEVWSAWRGGAIPSPEEAAVAVIHYAKNDAYLPAV
jgi:hypothetical protein